MKPFDQIILTVTLRDLFFLVGWLSVRFIGDSHLGFLVKNCQLVGWLLNLIFFEIKIYNKVEVLSRLFEVMQGCIGSEHFNVKLLEIGSESKKL